MLERKDHRFHLHLPIHFIRRKLTGTGFVLNLSGEGALMESDSGLLEGDYLELSLQLPGGDPPLNIESAAVRWVDGRVCGVQFLYMDAEEDMRLARLIEPYGRAGEDADSSTPEGSREARPDRRSVTRFTVAFQSSFSSAMAFGGHGIVRELSQRGCRVASDTQVPARIELEATIHLDAVSDPVRIELAVVRWSQENQFGLEFVIAEPRTFDRISGFLDSLPAQSPEQGG